MFSFIKSKETQAPVFYIDNKEVFVHFQKNEKLRIKPFRDSGRYLDSEDFRERYSLSRAEGKELKKAIQSNIVPEGKLKTKFYTIRKDLNQRLFSEIDLRGTDKTITWKYPKKPTAWPGSQIVIGSSGVGKTFLVIQHIMEALKRKKNKKRKFIYISPELHVDSTLKDILHRKSWAKYFRGVDVSEDEINESGLSPDQYWTQEVIPIIKSATPGTTIILDDAPSSVVGKQLQKFLIKYLRTGRHKSIGIISLQHNVRGGKWTSQSFSSVKLIVLFPRGSGRGKIVEFLNETVGLTRKEARHYVELFGDCGRSMTIHSWAPNFMFNEKYATFV